MPTSKPLGQNLLTVKDLAARWQVKPQAIRRKAKRYAKILKPIKPGKSLLFERGDVEKYEDQKRTFRDE